MGWPIEPNWGTIAVLLWFGLAPSLWMFLTYLHAFNHPMDVDEDALYRELAAEDAAR